MKEETKEVVKRKKQKKKEGEEEKGPIVSKDLPILLQSHRKFLMDYQTFLLDEHRKWFLSVKSALCEDTANSGKTQREDSVNQSVCSSLILTHDTIII